MTVLALKTVSDSSKLLGKLQPHEDFFSPIFRREIRKAKRATSSVEDSDQRHTGKTPVPGLLNEVERLNKAKQKRKGRQATTGVTLDVIKQAKELAKKNENKSASTYDRNTERTTSKIIYDVPLTHNSSCFITKRIHSKWSASIQGRAAVHQYLVKSKHCEARNAKENVSSARLRRAENSGEKIALGNEEVDHPWWFQWVIACWKICEVLFIKIFKTQYCISSDSSTHTAVTRKQSAESSKSSTLEAPTPSARTRTTSDSRRNSDMEFPQHLSRIRSPVPDKNVSISLLDKPRRCSKMASQLIERIRMESNNTGASLRTDLPQARSM